MKDPNVKLTYNGIDGTVGARQARESSDKNVGKGEQEIIKMENESAVGFINIRPKTKQKKK